MSSDYKIPCDRMVGDVLILERRGRGLKPRIERLSFMLGRSRLIE